MLPAACTEPEPTAVSVANPPAEYSPVQDYEPATNVPETPVISLYKADWKLGNPVSVVVPGWLSTFYWVLPDPERNTVYALNDIGVARTVVIWRSMDWGESWESLGEWKFARNQLEGAEIFLEQDSQRLTIPVHPQGSRQLGSEKTQLERRRAEEIIKREFFADSRNISLSLAIIAYDVLNPSVVIVGGTLSYDISKKSVDQWDWIPILYLSTDGGDTWVPVDMTSFTPFAQPGPYRSLGVAQDAENNIHLFAGTKGVWHAVLSLTLIPTSPATPFPQLMIATVPENIPTYNREEWRLWIDEDGDCQSTRHEVLIEESSVPVRFTNISECSVATGQWLAPFTGTAVTSASELDIDHMVPLANAHRSGGWAWDAAKKKAYANDLSSEGHLIAVTASANRSKGSRGPAEWRPPDTSYWCAYAIDWTQIKVKWDLTATIGEWEALSVMLDTCSERYIVMIVIGDSPSIPNPNDPATPTPLRSDNLGLVYDPHGPDRDCGDFDIWLDAQLFFLAAGGPDMDPHRLDGDRDGTPCESLPGAP